MSICLRATTHEHQCDSPLLLGMWLSPGVRKIDPKLGAKINTNLILRYLHQRVGKCCSSFRKCTIFLFINNVLSLASYCKSVSCFLPLTHCVIDWISGLSDKNYKIYHENSQDLYSVILNLCALIECNWHPFQQM